MPVLAVAIVTKTGKALLSRQFVDATRVRVESLLGAFPRLLEASAQHQQQHTFLETDAVRYLWQNIDANYLLVITNKSSNIVEDLEVLRMLTRILPDYCKNYSEAEIRRSCFEILFSFDEVISSQSGHREHFSAEQIRMYLSMESQEEKLANLIRESKESKARDEMRQKVKEIEEAKALRQAAGSSMGLSGNGGMGPGGYVGDSRSLPSSTSAYGAGAPSSPFATVSSSSLSSHVSSARTAAGTTGGKKVSGMQLKKSKGPDLFEQLQKEETPAAELAAMQLQGSHGQQQQQQTTQLGQSAAAAPVVLSIEEHLSAKLDRDGGVGSLLLTGELLLTIHDPSFCSIFISSTLPPPTKAKQLQMKTHPKLNREAFAQGGMLRMKDDGAEFPANADNLALVKWRSAAASTEDLLPVMVNVWPTPTANGMDLTVEYDVRADPTLALTDLVVRIPTPGATKISVSAPDEVAVDPAKRHVDWHVARLAPGGTGSIDLNVTGSSRDADSYFPCSVQVRSDAANSKGSLAGVTVVAVSSSKGAQVPYAARSALHVDEYVVQ